MGQLNETGCPLNLQSDEVDILWTAQLMALETIANFCCTESMHAHHSMGHNYNVNKSSLLLPNCTAVYMYTIRLVTVENYMHEMLPNSGTFSEQVD